MGIPHRNIRTGNVLFSEKGKYELKLIDFDASGTKKLRPEDVYSRGTYTNPFYTAPEVFDSEVNDKCDIWSIGCCLYFLFFGTPPYVLWPYEEGIALIRKGDYKKLLDKEIYEKISPEGKDLMSKLFKVNPDERPSADEALKHPWFLKAQKGDLKDKSLGKTLDALKNFTAGGKLKQALLGFMTTKMLSQTEINKMAE